MFFVFFFKQKTAYEMRISDWSSDVCSSDLIPNRAPLCLRCGHGSAVQPKRTFRGNHRNGHFVAMRLRNGAERKLPTDIWLNSQFSAYSTPACDGRAIMTRNESKMTLTIYRRALIRTAAWPLAPLAASMAAPLPAENRRAAGRAEREKEGE